MPKRSWPNGWQHPAFNGSGDAGLIRDLPGGHWEFVPFGWRCAHKNSLKIGEGVDVGYGTYIQAEEYVEIGDYTQIGSHCAIYSVDTERDVRGKVSIGKDCLIGSRCTILPGSVLPDGTRMRIGSIALVKKGKTVILEPVYNVRPL